MHWNVILNFSLYIFWLVKYDATFEYITDLKNIYIKNQLKMLRVLLIELFD